jgi:hypothetical protein
MYNFACILPHILTCIFAHAALKTLAMVASQIAANSPLIKDTRKIPTEIRGEMRASFLQEGWPEPRRESVT